MRNPAERAPWRVPNAFARALPPLIAAALVLAGCGAGASLPPAAHTLRGQTATPHRNHGSPGPSPSAACRIPRLPTVGSGPGQTLAGPVVAALRGGAARSAFQLDGGALRVAPPGAGGGPTVPARQAECDALAALNIDNAPLLDLARASGVALGYGRVTIASRLMAHAKAQQVSASGTGAMGKPTLPAAAPYRRRLAWIAIFKQPLVFHCPAVAAVHAAHKASAAASGPATWTPPRYGYAVFLLDARSGRDALLYTQGYRSPCGGHGRVPPTVTIPVDQVSVPWQEISRSANGYAGRISASVLSCDGYPNTVTVPQGRPVVRVVVERPVGAACGKPRRVTLSLATVTSNLPTPIPHGSVGLYLPRRFSQTAPPAAASGTLKNLGASASGKTIRITPNTVLVITPFPGIPHSGASPVVSSNTAVLGPLGAGRGPVAEFRAWQAGSAVLSIPSSACRQPHGTTPPCTRPWVVHVQVASAGA